MAGPTTSLTTQLSRNHWNGIDVARNHTVTIANNIINKNGTASGSTGGRFGIKRESSSGPQPLGIKLRNNLVCGNTLGEINGPVLDATDTGNFTPQGSEGLGVSAFPGCELPANLFANLNGLDSLPNTADDDFSLRQNSLAIDIGMDPRTLGFNPAFNPIFEADFAVEGVRPADGNADRWYPSMPVRLSFPTRHRLRMPVLIRRYLEVSLLVSTEFKAATPKERR